MNTTTANFCQPGSRQWLLAEQLYMDGAASRFSSCVELARDLLDRMERENAPPKCEQRVDSLLRRITGLMRGIEIDLPPRAA